MRVVAMQHALLRSGEGGTVRAGNKELSRCDGDGDILSLSIRDIRNKVRAAIAMGDDDNSMMMMWLHFAYVL